MRLACRYTALEKTRALDGFNIVKITLNTTMKFHTFYTDNLPNFVIEDHQLCARKIGIEVIYHKHKITDESEDIFKLHGDFLNNLLEVASENEVVCFLDIDCLPYSLEDLENAFNWASQNKSFIGNAQNISHTHRRNRIYAAASMLMIHKKSWVTLGKPSLSYSKAGSEESLIDTAQALSLAADEVGFEYRALLPIGYDDEKKSYQLGPFCSYGGGTTYLGSWHFFRISELKQSKPAIWESRVSQILSGQEIIPNYQSITNSFERVRPLKKLFTKRIKNLFK